MGEKFNVESGLGVTKLSVVWIMCYSENVKMAAKYVKMTISLAVGTIEEQYLLLQ